MDEAGYARKLAQALAAYSGSSSETAAEAYRQASRVAELRGDSAAATRWTEMAQSIARQQHPAQTN